MPSAPPLLPCPQHGDLPTLTPVQVWEVDFYAATVAPLALRRELTVADGRLAAVSRLDSAALQLIAHTWQIPNPKRFFTAMHAIFEAWTET